MITHDNEIAAQAKRVIRIRDGRIEADSKGMDGVPKRTAGDATKRIEADSKDTDGKEMEERGE